MIFRFKTSLEHRSFMSVVIILVELVPPLAHILIDLYNRINCNFQYIFKTTHSYSVCTRKIQQLLILLVSVPQASSSICQPDFASSKCGPPITDEDVEVLPSELSCKKKILPKCQVKTTGGELGVSLKQHFRGFLKFILFEAVCWEV